MVDNPQLFLKNARKQLLLWIDIIKEEMSSEKEGIEDRVFRELLKQDRLLEGYGGLDKDLKGRETNFIGNSIKGMLQYLQ
jgi:hypothetical protein